VAPLSECLGCLGLHALLALSDVVKAREGAVDIRVDLLPGLHVEHWVALRDLSDDNPVAEFADLLLSTVGILGHSGCLFEANRAHVVIVAVIDIGFRIAFETLLKVFQRLILIQIECFSLAVQFKRNSGLTTHAEIAIKQAEP